MQATDADRFRTLMTGMFEYYEKQPNQALMDVYWEGLRSWTIEDFASASGQLLKSSEFMPRLSAYEKLRVAASTQTAGQVFGDVRKWLQYSPSGYTTKADTPRDIASAIAACGGANAIAMCTLDGLPFLEKRFTEHYKQISGGSEVRRSLPNLGLPAEMLGFDDET